MNVRRVTGQTVIALVIVLVGLVLLGRTTDIYDATIVFRYIPSLFVLAGLYALWVSNFRNWLGSIIVIVVAGAWQLVVLDVVEAEQIAEFWPLLIVLFGLSILFGQYRARTHAKEVGDAHPTALALFGGSEGRSTTKALKGADLTAIFGGVEFDLREATIEDRPAHVSTTAVFGGVDIAVPDDWNVRIDVLPLFGGTSDDRPRFEERNEEVDLVVTGMALFGGVSIT